MKRLPNESFDDYKKRRKEVQGEIKEKLKGRIVYDSSNGPRIKPKLNRDGRDK